MACEEEMFDRLGHVALVALWRWGSSNAVEERVEANVARPELGDDAARSSGEVGVKLEYCTRWWARVKP